jgi:histidine ammonia-lyase
MESLVGMALFLSLQEAFAEAIILLTFVLAQQATEMEAREKGERVLADLLPQVSADVRIMAQEKGKTADLNAIQQLLQEAELCAGIRVNS